MQYFRPLQSHSDAVEKDEGQDHVVKELMGDNGLAEQSEPDKTERWGVRGKQQIRGGFKIYPRIVLKDMRSCVTSLNIDEDFSVLLRENSLFKISLKYTLSWVKGHSSTVIFCSVSSVESHMIK